MLRKIILENFMSHGRTEIDLADGLTVLTGPNNCGKSAVVAALQILATNGRTTHVTRHGAKFSRVTVETDDDHIVVWERKGTTVKYTLDGEDIHRVGVSTPDRLHDLLRLDRVESEMGKTKHDYDIHFGEQKSPVFLLGETGSRAASFFASSSDASRLVEMQHRHRSNVADRKKDAKRLSEELQANEKRLQAFAPLDTIAQSVARAESMAATIESARVRTELLKHLVANLTHCTARQVQFGRQHNVLINLDRTPTTPQSLQSAADRYHRLSRLIESLTALSRRTVQLKGREAIYQALKPVPLLLPAERCKSMIGAAKSLSKRIDDASAAGLILDRLRSPPTIHDVERLDSLRRRITKATAKQVNATKSIKALAGLSELPRLADTERWRAAIEKLKRTNQRASQLQVAARNLGRLKPVEDPHVTDKLVAAITRLRTAQASVDAAKQAAHSAIRSSEMCEAELRAFVAENPTCQTCGASIDPETLLSAVPGVHQHHEHRSDSKQNLDPQRKLDV